MIIKRKISKLCVITPRYPTESNPVHTFIDQLVCEIEDIGIDCNVISPYSITERVVKKSTVSPRERKRITKNGNIINVYSPRYMSLSQSVFGIKTSMLTFRNFRNAVIKEYQERNLQAHSVYGHFIYPSGMCAADLGAMLGVPSFLAYGESSPASYIHVKKTMLQEKLKKLTGVISVSSENKRELIEMGIFENGNCIGVFPNAIDENKFFKIDREKARKELGIENDKFVVAFVGHFIERKGVTVLSNVLNQLDDVYSIFIGSGVEEPQCKNILFKGTVPHEKVHVYLNAADVFILPTSAEGCCNAIIEAMACGLPIVSSNQPFNDDILNIENSIRLDVKDVVAVRQAIVFLRDNPGVRNRMSKTALISAANLNIRQRAQNIIDFMESKI